MGPIWFHSTDHSFIQNHFIDEVYVHDLTSGKCRKRIETEYENVEAAFTLAKKGISSRNLGVLAESKETAKVESYWEKFISDIPYFTQNMA